MLTPVSSYIDGCGLCREFAGVGGHPFADHYSEILSSREIWRARGLRVLPTIGQLAKGHLLLIPDHHVTAFGRLTKSDRRQAEESIRSLHAFMSCRYGQTVIFEHGSCGSLPSGGCGIVHAHMHFVPVATKPATLPPIPRARWKSISGSPLETMAACARRQIAYVFYAEELHHSWYTEVAQLPSQLVRRWLASQIGATVWDWREAGFECDLLGLVEDLRASEPPTGFSTPHAG